MREHLVQFSDHAPVHVETLIITDPSGETVGEVVIERGQFSMVVPKREDYFIQLKSKKVDAGEEEQEEETFGPFRPDDNILIRLNRTQP